MNIVINIIFNQNGNLKCLCKLFRCKLILIKILNYSGSSLISKATTQAQRMIAFQNLAFQTFNYKSLTLDFITCLLL